VNWKQINNWSSLDRPSARVSVSAEAWMDEDSHLWGAVVRIVPRANIDDSRLQAPAVFVTREAAQLWCERAIEALMPLMEEVTQ